MDKVILGKKAIIEGDLGQTRPNDNQLVIGGTGSGKTMSVLIPTMAHMTDTSLIATFAKKSIIPQTKRHFERKGYKTYIWNLANPTPNDKIPDPLAYVKSDDDVQELAKQIANGNPLYERATKFDPYWRDASEALISGLIYYILMTEEKPSMKAVIDMFYKIKIKETGRSISSTIDEEMLELNRRAPDSLAARKLNAFFQTPFVTACCIRDDLEKSIQNIFPVSIQNAMSIDASVDFRKIAKELSAVFIVTSPVRVSQYAFANLLFGTAIRSLMEYAEDLGGRLPRNVKLAFDDFSCGAPIHNFEKTISTFRAAGISCLMLCQSLSQLDDTYGQDKSVVIMDNISSIAYLPGGLNQQTASYVSKMLDVPMNDILFMPMGNVVVFQSGKKPIICERFNTPDDPLCKQMLGLDKKDKEAKYA